GTTKLGPLGRTPLPWGRGEGEDRWGVRGIIFCNELLDALPVHRWGWDAKRRTWFEWGVTLKDGGFVWTRLAQSKVQGRKAGVQSPQRGATLQRFNAATLQRLPEGLLDNLPDGVTVEICPAAE